MTMHSVAGVLFAALVIAGIITGMKASTKLANRTGKEAKSVFAFGRAAGRENFTDTGWRYRNLSLMCQALAMVAGVVWVITTKGR